MGLLGRVLRPIRAGETHLAWNHPALASAPASIELTSTAFAPRGPIPLRYAGKGVGDNVSPPLAWKGVPAQTAQLVLVMQDPDAPIPRPITHVLVAAVPTTVTDLPEGRLSSPGNTGDGLMMGRNTFGQTVYAGPRPVPDHGVHTYVFQLYALDRRLDFGTPPRLKDVLARMAGAVIARGRLDGTYER